MRSSRRIISTTLAMTVPIANSLAPLPLITFLLPCLTYSSTDFRRACSRQEANRVERGQRGKVVGRRVDGFSSNKLNRTVS
jgi:hypothetical protein